MGRGPHKPTALRALEGGRSHSLPKPDEALAKEPTPAVVCPDPPKELNTRAKKIWKDLGPKLAALGLLTEADEGAFFVLCHELAILRESADALRTRNPLLETEEETKRFRHLEAVFHRTSASFMKNAKEFGCTPRGRVGLVVGSDVNGEQGVDLLT